MGNKAEAVFSFVLIRVDSQASAFHDRDGRVPFCCLEKSKLIYTLI